ncbi:MAG: response regulator transcription factor [Acidobacteriaceae bacterium]|jgi:DNA-binding NarL/FixJ family response regulator|nr:response regulator transcription factor [Acidobacteriaceae bacterium]
MKPNTILLADDHALVLEGLQRILENQYTLLGTVHDGRELVQAVERLRPDLVVCDISMPELNGLEALSHCRAKGLRTRFIFVTGSLDATLATRAFRLGAEGYVLKHAATDELLNAIHEVLQGRTYVTPRIADKVLRNLMVSPEDRSAAGTELSQREREVLQLIAEGKTMKEAATALDVSPRTVEFHKKNIMDKTGLRTTAELSRYAVRQGISVEPE